MKTREQNRNNKRTEIERFDWCIERIQTHLGFGWLSERSGKQTSCPKNFLEIALTSYCNTIGQSNNAFSILGFLWRENKESMFFSFHPFADETKNEHLPKPFFKVIRKSLYRLPAMSTDEYRPRDIPEARFSFSLHRLWDLYMYIQILLNAVIVILVPTIKQCRQVG